MAIVRYERRFRPKRPQRVPMSRLENLSNRYDFREQETVTTIHELYLSTENLTCSFRGKRASIKWHGFDVGYAVPDVVNGEQGWLISIQFEDDQTHNHPWDDHKQFGFIRGAGNDDALIRVTRYLLNAHIQDMANTVNSALKERRQVDERRAEAGKNSVGPHYHEDYKEYRDMNRESIVLTRSLGRFVFLHRMMQDNSRGEEYRRHLSYRSNYEPIGR